MFSFIVAFVLGLIVGWNFLDQPIWVRNFIYKWQVKLGMIKDNDFNPDN